MSEQSMIEQSASRLFGKYTDTPINQQVEAGEFPTQIWDDIESSGFLLSMAKEPDGFGLSMAETLPVLYHQGYNNVPAPVAETLAGTALLSFYDIEAPSGPGAFADSRILNTVNVSSASGATTVSGQLASVAWGRHAAWLLADLQDGRIALIDMTDKTGIQIRAGKDTAGMPSDFIQLSEVKPLAVLNGSDCALTPALRMLGAMTQSAMAVGALERCLQQAIQYAMDRTQFGRPIGKNQAIQQQIAEIAGEVAAAAMATRTAASDFTLSDPSQAAKTEFGIAVAKILCGEATTRTTSVVHEVLGAIGFTREHSLQLSTRRLWAWRQRYGTEAWWANALGKVAIRSGQDAFWPTITSRTLPERLFADSAAQPQHAEAV